MWIYGQGFPKSLDVSKAIDKAAGVERTEVIGRMKKSIASMEPGAGNFSDDSYQWKAEFDRTAPATDAARKWSGFGTALKPAHEPIVLARKPLIGMVATNVLAHGTGALNVDGCRIGTTKDVPASAKTVPASTHTVSMPGKDGTSGFDPNIGRWPANVLHDGSDEVVGAFPERHVNASSSRGASKFWGMKGQDDIRSYENNDGSAARFFYSAKASKKERRGSKHPTVKPLALMRYLVRLVTPPGGVVLDPFAGSGTTGEAARAEGFKAILIEQQREYQRDIQRRVSEALKAKGRKVAA
jgi:site-specific DNA-methyltransferase (adenine-specific)